jgi:hypothetical protein
MTRADIIRDKKLLEKLKKQGISLLMICEIWSLEKLEKAIQSI